MEHGKISPRVIEAIQKARAAGHLFLLCTGRSKGNTPDWLLNAEFVDGYVLGCGMHCQLHGEEIYHERVPDEVVLAVAQYYFANGRECLFEGEKQLLSINSTRLETIHFADMEQLRAVLGEQPVTKITIPGKYCAADGEFLSRWFTVYDMGDWSDAVTIGVTKATGMQRVLDFLGARREDCIGVGDGTNDLPMIEFAGLGVAMGNAPDAVKARADVVTATCAEDGLALILPS